jgi:hypothetical protein
MGLSLKWFVLSLLMLYSWLYYLCDCFNHVVRGYINTSPTNAGSEIKWFNGRSCICTLVMFFSYQLHDVPEPRSRFSVFMLSALPLNGLRARICPFVIFLLAILLYVFHRSTVSEKPFGISKLFLPVMEHTL